ncbi:MAG TPA: DUF3099 domain-containing protein [Streptosporangiaceae bacterium]|jgi:hypothetical protein
MVHRAPREQIPLVTEAKRPMSEDIAYRERRYLVMMGIRVLCFLLALLLFVLHAGWLAAIPAVGAIAIPYFAVVFANGGREPTSTRGFRPYEPNLPERSFGSSGPPEWPAPSPRDGTTPVSGRVSDSAADSQRHTQSHEDPGSH